MKKILNVLVLTLAMNFLLVAGFVAWLSHDGRLDRARITAIKQILSPPPPVEAPATQPVTDRLAEPTMKLEELLAKTAGRPAAEQLDYIRKSFDSQMAQLDRAHRELLDLNQQVEQARSKLNEERKVLDDKAKKLADREQQAQRLASDQGFQANLATDGAPIHTDGAEGSDGQLGAFQAIFQQLSQQIAIEKAAPEAQPTEAADAPKLPSAPNLPHLPNLPDVPPAAVANQQVAA